MTKFLVSLQILTLALLVGIIALSRSGDAALEEEIRELKAVARGAAPAGVDLTAVETKLAQIERMSDEIITAFEFLAVDIDGIKRNTWEVLQTVKALRGTTEIDLPEDYKRLFEPETREALLAAAAEKGVRLKEDRVEVDGVIVQNRAMLEFFAVITGGKEHEAVVAVTGSFDREGERLPERLGATINACILALGYERGTPVDFRDGKVVPARGMTVHVYIEWEGEDGETVRARAEDLIYNIAKERPMERGRWVYIGSRFEQDPMSGDVVYLADLTGDLVATYSWPNTIIDNTTSEALDDVNFVAHTPRIPPLGTKVNCVFSKEELPAKEFPEEEEEPAKDDGGAGK